MSYTQTTNLNLYKEDSNESIRSLRVHNNENVDILDTQIQALKDVIVNAKALLGQLGVDANGDPLIDINTARGVLNAAADGTSGEETLYSVNQQAAQNAVDIASLQDSVSVYAGTNNPITARFDLERAALLFTYRIDTNSLTVDVYVNGNWKGQKALAQW